jgi:putative membrane protein
MLGFVVSTLVVAIALAVTATVLPQITYGGETQTLLIVAVIFGLVNALVKPIVKLLSLPLRLATLGTFTFVINAGLLLLVAWLSGQVDITFQIADFPPDLTAETLGVALVASLIISAVTTAIGLIIPG